MQVTNSNSYINNASRPSSNQLSADQQKSVDELKKIDREVRAHEAAHQAAGAGLTGGASYTYTRGPDGRMYATGGEVSIDVSPVDNDPAATIQKATQIMAAATAPSQPSGQDMAVASAAAAMAAQARSELLKAKFEQMSGTDNRQQSIIDISS